MSADEVIKHTAETASAAKETDRLTLDLQRMVGITADFHRHITNVVPVLPEQMSVSLTAEQIGPSIMGRWLAEAQAAQRLQQMLLDDALAAALSVWKNFEVDWQGIHQQVKQTLQCADHVGRLGWTFSMEMTLPDIAELSAMERVADADAYMGDWYATYDPHLTESEKRISDMTEFSSFQLSLAQCFSAFRRRDYALTIPFLMAVVERGIQALGPPRTFPTTDVKKTVTQRYTKAKRDFPNDDFMPSVWMSLHAFIHRLYESSSSADASDHRPSRHALLHGIQAPPNEKIEVIRLVHAIQTIAFCSQVDAKKAANLGSDA